MRIGIRAHDVAYAPLEELIPNIHAQGFHCMHIALSKSIKEFKPGVETMTPGLAMYIKELCTENKVDVAVLGCYLNLCNPNPEKQVFLDVELLVLRLVQLMRSTSMSQLITVRRHFSALLII